MNRFKIENPCDKSWEEMQQDPNGKFCGLCKQKVWDLEGKSSDEIGKILSENSQICGKLSRSKLNLATGLLIAISLTASACAVSPNLNKNSVENLSGEKIKISGKISSAEGITIKPTSIKLVTKSKLISGVIEDDNFEIELAESELKDENIIKIEYSVSTEKQTYTDYSLHLVSKKDLLSQKTLIAEDGMVQIGAVVILSPEPPDFYYFNGNSISKNKHEKLLKEFPNLEKVFLDEDPFKTQIIKQYSGTVYLLYSN